MHLGEAQRDMRRAYVNGGVGIFASGLVWTGHHEHQPDRWHGDVILWRHGHSSHIGLAGAFCL